jgi:hypothetical protein
MDMATLKKPLAVGAKEIRAWIDSGEPRSAIDVLITPEIARLLLKHNSAGETNRNLSRSYVDDFRSVILRDAWENTGEPIIMSDVGLLNDGQHRLQAIVESGMSCTLDLRFGIRRGTFANTNSGRKRSGHDALTISGYKDTFAMSAAVRLALCYERGLPTAMRQRVGNGEITRAVERWPDFPDAMAMSYSLRKPLRNACTNALAFFAMRTANQSSVEEFLTILRFGEGSADNPPHILRDFMMVTNVGQGQDSTTRMRVFAACILAWNAWRKPSKAKLNLYWKEGQRFPVCEGLAL